MNSSSLIAREPLISMAEAGKYIGERTGQRPYLSTLYRWALKGVRGRLLETVEVGRQRFTSVSAIQRFIAGRQEPAVTEVTVRPDRRTKVDAREDVERLTRRLGSRKRKRSDPR